MNVKRVLLDTRDKQTGSTTNEPVFSLDVQSQLNGPYGFALKSAVIPNLVYPVNSSNNTFVFAEGGGSNITSTLTAQNYTGTQLASELQTVLNADGGLVYTVSYDSQTGKLTIAPSSSTVQFKTTNTAFTASFVLGFDDTTDTADASSITSDYPVRLDGSMYIDIELSGMSPNTVTSKNTSTPLCRIPLAGSFGAIITYENDSVKDEMIHIDSTALSHLRMRIRDDMGSTWTLPDNAYCSFTFNLYSL